MRLPCAARQQFAVVFWRQGSRARDLQRPRTAVFEKVESYSNAEFDRFAIPLSSQERPTNYQNQTLRSWLRLLGIYAPIIGVWRNSRPFKAVMSWIIALGVVELLAWCCTFSSLPCRKSSWSRILNDRLNLTTVKTLTDAVDPRVQHPEIRRKPF